MLETLSVNDLLITFLWSPIAYVNFLKAVLAGSESTTCFLIAWDTSSFFFFDR